MPAAAILGLLIACIPLAGSLGVAIVLILGK